MVVPADKIRDDAAVTRGMPGAKKPAVWDVRDYRTRNGGVKTSWQREWLEKLGSGTARCSHGI